METESTINMETESTESMEDIQTEIREMFPEVNFPEPILEPIFYGRLSKTVVNNRKLIIDKNTGHQFDIVSDQYNLVPHEKVVKTLLQAIPDEFGTPDIKVKIHNHGARSLIEASFPEIGKYNIQGSEINPMVRVKNSYDRSSHLVFTYGALELVCSNGLMLFNAKEKGKAKHVSESINRFKLRKRIQSSLEDFSEKQKIWLAYAEMKLDELQIKEVVETLPFSEKESEDLLVLPLLNHGGESIKSLGKNATLWSVNSAGTQAKERIRSENRNAELDYKVASAVNKFYMKYAA